ncbi:MAG: hypothetical protein EKK41_21945 [Hyphomicrobiales bacterium]|nr:MAG: hypothetical protein EKK41_21945 [Hyphomicrobiales bacterium]
MNSKALLSRLERIEVTAFGIDREGRGEQWIERERRLLRLYFAMGLTGSGIVGAIGLLVLLAVAAGPGYDAWFGLQRRTDRPRTAWDAPAGPSVSIETTAKSDPVVQSDAATPSIELAAGNVEPLRPPFVRVISVVPLAQKAPPAPAKPAAAKPVFKPQRVEAAAAKPVPAPDAVPSVEPSIAPAPASDSRTVALLPPSGVERPEGIVNLGGPGRSGAAADEPVTWWRKLWWGTGGFAASQK